MSVNWKDYQTSIMNCGFYDDKQLALIWDFYVSHGPSSDSQLRRKAIDYDWKKGFNMECFFKNTKIEKSDFVLEENGSLKKVGKLYSRDSVLSEGLIKGSFIRHQRQTKNGIFSKEKPEPYVDCFLRHIRNALCHSLTYFIPTIRMALFEDTDKNGSTITARLVFPAPFLIDVIKKVDVHHKFY